MEGAFIRAEAGMAPTGARLYTEEVAQRLRFYMNEGYQSFQELAAWKIGGRVVFEDMLLWIQKEPDRGGRLSLD